MQVVGDFGVSIGRLTESRIGKSIGASRKAFYDQVSIGVNRFATGTISVVDASEW
jgi:hypothetical protein